QRPLIVCGRHSARAIGALDAVLAQYPHAAVFDRVEENPTTAACEAGAEFCREAGCDWIIAIGGGSPMDAAKAIALLTHNPGGAARYFHTQTFSSPVLPVVAIPTTAGTGSEVTQYAVLTDTEKGQKRTLRG